MSALFNLFQTSIVLRVLRRDTLEESVYRRTVILYKLRCAIKQLYYTAYQTVQQVAQQYSRHYKTVRKIVNKAFTLQVCRHRLQDDLFIRELQLLYIPKRSHSMFTTDQQRRIIEFIIQNTTIRRITFRQIRDTLNLLCSLYTILRIYRRFGYRRYITRARLFYANSTRTKRLEYTILYRYQTKEDQANVLQSDKSAIRNRSYKRLFVIRLISERNTDVCLRPRFQRLLHQIIQACILGIGSKGPLVLQNNREQGNINAKSY